MERRGKFIALMDKRNPDWDTALIIENVNQYYFTGTIQDGIVIIRQDGKFTYGVRRSIERALSESPLPENEISGFSSYRDLAQVHGSNLGNVYLEGDIMPLVTRDRLAKYFHMNNEPRYLDSLLRTLRSVKSPYELQMIRLAGEAHRLLLKEKVPVLLREGMTENDLLGELNREMYRLGYHGLSRFHQFQVDMSIGQIGFGDNTLVPTLFDGPGGSRGNGPWSQFGGDCERRLKKGECVFVDCGFGIGGYHSDKTQVYFYGGEVPGEFHKAHQFCVDIQKRIVDMLKPGEIPSKIFETIMDCVSADDMKRFMGVNAEHRVKFLGHGVGLNVDDFPVIAKGFDEPLEENMVIALEPKYAVPGIGLAGVEDTYLVASGGAECLTGGGGGEIIAVPGK